MKGGPETLTARQLNRALLARQLLLERAPVDVPQALELMGCLQAQYAPSMYIGLWSRVEGLRRDDVTQALEHRTAIQGTLMRVTIHLVSAPDYWPLALAVRTARRSAWLKAIARDMRPEDFEAAAARLRERLAEGPIRRAELEKLCPKPLSSGVGLWVDLVRAPPSGTWDRRRADLYALAEDWVGPPPSDLTVEAATDHLVRRYLTGFGPSTVHEIADWGGLGVAEVGAALERLSLRRFRTEDGHELVDLPRAPHSDRDTPAPVRFIPTWDAMLLVHARRKAVLPEEYRPLIFNTKMPQSIGTFLVDGSVAGTWKYKDGRVVTEPFTLLSRQVQGEVDDEAERLAAFHA